MYKLSVKREPYWLDLPFGVKVQLKPFCTSTINAVQYGATRQVRKLKEQFDELKKVGKQNEAFIDFNDKDAVGDLINNLVMKGYACSSILAWEGVGHPTKEGEQAECNQKNIEHLVEEPKIGRALWDHITTDLAALFDEGKFSSPAPNGTSEMGLDTATDANNKD